MNARDAVEARMRAKRVWGVLEDIPGLTEQLRAAEAELDAGGGVLYEVDDLEPEPVEDEPE